MRTDKYYTASAEITERGGFTPYRHRTENGRYILSESDIRNMVASGILEIEELGSLDISEVNYEEVQELILNGKAAERRMAASASSSSDEEDATEEQEASEESEENESEEKEVTNGKKD